MVVEPLKEEPDFDLEEIGKLTTVYNESGIFLNWINPEGEHFLALQFTLSPLLDREPVRSIDADGIVIYLATHSSIVGSCFWWTTYPFRWNMEGIYQHESQ